MSDIPKRLAEPFDPAIVSWRVGPTTKDKSKGMALAYIDARDVMRRLDDVCGAANWQDEYPWSDGKRVVCRLGVRIGDEWIWKTDGAGDTDTEGEKGALSDAFKRAAVKWGVGRYLYDVEAAWVQIEQRGNSYIIAESEYAKLRARLPRPGKAAPVPTAARNADPFSPPAQNGTSHQAPAAAPRSDAADQRRRAAREELVSQWFRREDYGINPDVMEGGLAAWDGWFLDIARAAPNVDAFLKLKAENIDYHARWYKKSADEVRKHLAEQIGIIEHKLSDKERSAA